MAYGDATMKIFMLGFEIRDFWVDRNDCIGKLEVVGECVYNLVVLDKHISACSCLKPSIAVSAEEYGTTAGVVESIVAHDDATRCAEEGASGSVVADNIAYKLHSWTPCEVFNTICFLLRINIV